MDKTSFAASSPRQETIPIGAFLYRTFWQIMDWIYPPLCAGCGQQGVRFCSGCESSILYLQSHLCECCGQPIHGQNSTLCPSCSEDRPVFNQLRSLAVYKDAIREALLAMKFHQDFGISEYFGFKLVTLLQNLNWQFDAIIPIPLNSNRHHSRGFNQAYRLAIPIALSFKKPICKNGLIRTTNTLAQADLPREQRWQNVQKAFFANQELVEGKRILLVDDIATTNATMKACSTELLKKHAAAVLGITVARAVL